MLLITAALAQVPAPDVFAWSTDEQGDGHLIVALTTASLDPGITWVVTLTGAEDHAIACTRTADLGMVCRFDDTSFRTGWGQTTQTAAFQLFAGPRAAPSPSPPRRGLQRRRDRERADGDETVVIEPVEALVMGVPLGALGPRGPVQVDARAVRRSWRSEVDR